MPNLQLGVRIPGIQSTKTHESSIFLIKKCICLPFMLNRDVHGGHLGPKFTATKGGTKLRSGPMQARPQWALFAVGPFSSINCLTTIYLFYWPNDG
jgi:hypothetical protein